ncbi:ATP synthase F0 subunit B [Actinoalloteichus caeruleus]|uniref:ATP synthase F0 subunit B n=2 Tax=Actinoalloteichus cyanogriseus TaxID=2893586 RepID=UPI00068C08A7|nr:ATP synthase F0 subunit B [Actinoalloteichus caeruleus]
MSDDAPPPHSDTAPDAPAPGEHQPPEHPTTTSSALPQPTGTCNYPDCGRPVFRAPGPGRPSEYCDRPDHTRWRAWRERQRRQEPTPANVTVTKPAGPVTAATGRAADLLDEFRTLSHQLSKVLAGAVSELSTISDPAASQEQIQQIQAEGARRIAEAETALLVAQRQRRDADDARRAAEQATEDAIAAAEAAETERTTALAERDTALRAAERDTRLAQEQAEVARTEAEVAIAAARREATDSIEQARDQAVRLTEAARRQAAQDIDAIRRAAAEDISAERELREQAAVRAERADTLTRHAERQVDELRAELSRAREETTRLREHHAQEIDQLNQLLAERQRAATDAANQARDLAAERLAALEAIRDQALTRAERAERHLDRLLAEREPTHPPRADTPAHD